MFLNNRGETGHVKEEAKPNKGVFLGAQLLSSLMEEVELELSETRDYKVLVRGGMNGIFAVRKSLGTELLNTFMTVSWGQSQSLDFFIGCSFQKIRSRQPLASASIA